MFNIAGINIQLLTHKSKNILSNQFKHFISSDGIPYTIIRHNLSNDFKYNKDEFKTVYKNNNWLIKANYKNHLYEYISEPWIKPSYKVSVLFDSDYSSALSTFQNITEQNYFKLKLNSLSGLGTNQALFSNLLVDRKGFMLHGNGVNIDGKNYIFTGSSGNGKTTISNMLLNNGADIFSDDRTIVKKINDDFYTYGSCIHPGNITKPNHKGVIDGIFCIEQSKHNNIELINDKQYKYNLLLKSVIKSFLNKEKLITLLDSIDDFINIPFYKLEFNLDGNIYKKLKEIK